MELNQILELIPEGQSVRIIFNAEKLEGPNSSMTLLDKEVFKLTVDNIDAREDVLCIWLSYKE